LTAVLAWVRSVMVGENAAGSAVTPALLRPERRTDAVAPVAEAVAGAFA